MAASAPSSPRRMASMSERSPSTSSAPRSRSAVALSGERTSATTSSPRSRSLRATWPPMNPVAPVTKTRMAGAYTGVMDTGRHGRKTESRYGEGIRNPRARQRALLIAAGPDEPDLAELRELLRTAGVAVAGELTQRRPAPDPDRHLRKGKLTELKRAIGESVAQLEYNLARMRGLWTHLERLGAGRMDGGIGTRGPGETQIETDRRLARDRIAALRRRLEHTRATRAAMRRERERAHLPTVALAGYTNAGKSTLLNALTGASAGVRDRLFHTLDPTTRAFEIAGRPYLLTDTVGFIRKLPHQLVEAFGATLEETLRAALVVHLVDAAAPHFERFAVAGARGGEGEQVSRAPGPEADGAAPE